MKTTKLIILGATGSIGRQTIDCLERANAAQPGRFFVTGMSAGKSAEALAAIGQRFPGATLALDVALENDPRFRYVGPGSSIRLLRETGADLVVNGIAGAPGLLASVEALAAGNDLALANKESVVMGYSHLAALAAERGSTIIPVDSEHAALFQLVRRIGKASVSELTITASGGPFRARSAAELERITPDEAARHPVWKMGRKISIDSATLANKGLELIEAVRLFGVPEERVKVLIHPESLVHAMVRTFDSALYAHISAPDMRLPINIALNWPEEVEASFGALDLAGKSLHFEEPDATRFPMLELARKAVRVGEAATIAYNAADEIAVLAFENGRLRFTQIASVVARVLERDWALPVPDVGSIFDHDARARSLAQLSVSELAC